jgi:hypothetical protein
MPMIAKPGGALGWGMQGAAASEMFPALSFADRYGSAILSGGGAFGAQIATGINPLTAITPGPIIAASLGALTLNPVSAAGRVWSGVTGWKGIFSKTLPGVSSTWEYGGAWGYKTLLAGLGETPAAASMWAKASLGNVVLSATEALGTFLRDAGGMQSSTIIQAMSNARRLGLAGMLNVTEGGAAASTAAAMKHKWAYYLAGRDPIAEKAAGNLSTKILGDKKSKIVGTALKQVGGKGSLTVSPIVTATGVTVAGGMAGKALSIASGAYSLYTLYQIGAFAGGWSFKTAVAGMGEAATSIMNYLGEINKPNMGRGRIPTSLLSDGAATERQRAIRASYASKINPSNRMYGNEAQYHHSR